MPQINASTTSGSTASSATVHRAADGDRHAVSSPADNLYKLLTREVNASGNEAVQENHPEEGAEAFAEAAPTILRDLQDIVRSHPKGTRGTLQFRVAGEYIAISENHAGLEIEDDKSGKSHMIPDMDFDSFMHALVQEVEDKLQLYGTEAVGLAGKITARTLIGLPQELREEIIGRMESRDSAALACAGRSLYEDPRVESSAMESVGPALMKRNHLDGLNTALERVMALPVSYRVAPLLALAKAVLAVGSDDQGEAFRAIRMAAGSLQRDDTRKVLWTLLEAEDDEIFGSKPPAASTSH